MQVVGNFLSFDIKVFNCGVIGKPIKFTPHFKNLLIMKKLLLMFAATLLFSIVSIAQYEIGSTGPAGGIIFYDKGNDIDGWRYLEAAPNVVGNAPWGCYGTLMNLTNSAIGSGLQNSINIVNTCGPNTAAAVCLNYSLNNFDDWFLPSIDELVAMYNNLNSIQAWNYNAANGQYWSSTESFDIGSYIITVLPGLFDIADDNKNWTDYIIPCRKALYTSNNNNETTNTSANIPSSISYQAVARDPLGLPLADTNMQVQFTLIADSITGTVEYVETHTLTTNSLGLFTTAFGAGTPVSNTFGNINWSAGNKYVKVQIDTGNGWIEIGTQQLLSTPYSLFSAKAGEIKNPGLPVFSNNAAALAGGLVAGDMYRTAAGVLMVVY